MREQNKSCIGEEIFSRGCKCNNKEYTILEGRAGKKYYNIARTLVLSKSYWAIMNKIFMYARPCSIKWRVQFHFSCKISVEFSASSLCLSFGNLRIILNNPKTTSSLWLLPEKDVYFNMSILTLFVSIFIEYLYFWLRFHYEFVIDNFSDQVKRFHSTVAWLINCVVLG